MTIKHVFTSAKSEGGDSSFVRPSDWNADHVVQALALPEDETSTGTGTIDDYALASTSAVLRWNGGGAATLNSVTGGADGRVLIILNVTSAQTLTIAHETGTTTGARFWLPGSSNYLIGPYGGAIFVYDATASRWKMAVDRPGYSSTPAATTTTGNAGTAGVARSRGDHAHPHEAAHIAHDTLWDAAGDLIVGSGADTAVKLTKGASGRVLEAGASTVSWTARAFSVGGTILSPSSGTTVMAWRAPFACTVTNVRMHFKGGTSIVVNAQKNQASTHLSSNYTHSTANAWGDGTGLQNTAYSAGDDLELMFVTINGAVTEASIQVDFTRP